MKTKLTALLAATAASTLFLASPALADGERSYRIDAHSDSTINMDICSPTVRIFADGDNDTDLDFWVYNEHGNLIHTDVDNTDMTIFTASNTGAGNGRCINYQIKVHNYGNVYNQMLLRLTDVGDGGGGGGGGGTGGGTGVYAIGNGGGGNVTTQSIRSEANSNQSYSLRLCAPQVYMEARGDGDTDIDFWVYDENGNQVHSDTDSTDITFATLRNGRGHGNCVNYSIRLRNYGNVWNQVEIKLTEQ